MIVVFANQLFDPSVISHAIMVIWTKNTTVFQIF